MTRRRRKYRIPCIIPGCKCKPYARGLCDADYRAFRVALSTGAITEDEAIARGLALPRKPHNLTAYNQRGKQERWKQAAAL